MMALFSRSTERASFQVLAALMAALAISSAMSASSASAAGTGPAWAIKSVALPTNFSAGDNKACLNNSEGGNEECDSYLVTVTNTGTRRSEGTVTVKDALPAGVVFKRLLNREGLLPNVNKEEENELAPEVECPEEAPSSLRCTTSQPIPPGGVLILTIEVTVSASGPATETNHAEVEGGGAATVATSPPSTTENTVNGKAAPFGFQDFSFGVLDGTGVSDHQAGDHPETVTTTLDYTTEREPRNGSRFRPVLEPKTEIVDLPLGFVGDPLGAEQCPESALYLVHFSQRPCPANSLVGVVAIDKVGKPLLSGVYNMVPEPGYPAEFGFEVNQANVFMRARVLPSSAGYVLSVSVPDVPRAVHFKVTGVGLTFFGDPAERLAELRREQVERKTGSEVTIEGFTPTAFFTNPTDCSKPPLQARIEMNSWVNPQQWAAKETTMYEASATQGVSGCNLLAFTPTIEVAPEETWADTPSGYEVDLKVPQAANLYPVLATPDLRNAEVTLPEGVSVSPSSADGLVGCNESGPEGIELGNHDTLGHEVQEGEELGADGLPHAALGHCPKASQIGTVEVTTPLLREKLEGHVYLAEPKCGGEGQSACTEASATNGELFGLYLEAAGSGVIVKLKGTVSVNPVTGRITTRFDENPQLPFSELKLKLNGGPRAPLANPQSCGEARTTSVLEPWSAPDSGSPATPFSSFAVTGCASPMPFSPTFSAGTLIPAAGAFSPFTLSFSRSDGQQDLSGLTVQTPPGLLGMLSAVQLCPEPQASQGTCGPQSLIGHTLVAAGAGSHPFSNPGIVYLTGPYKGQPFGLSIVTPAKAGPFNLGNVIVRASIHVDPHTSALTVTSDPLPQIVDGVPLRIQTVNVSIDKPDFMFNPTNCAQQQITATILSAQGATAGVSTPFAAAGCKNLPFAPKFSANTAGAAHPNGPGASFHVRVLAHEGPTGSGQASGEANIKRVEVQLPKLLPARLTTLQKSCTQAQFSANPAGCPEFSFVGTATAHTPVLANALTGPAILVSHGGAAFPDLVIVLQGEGIVLDLVGNTQITKGITYSRFETIPDAPVSSFELDLPQSKHSALSSTSFSGLCGQNLVMPTFMEAQNGAQLHQNTQIEITGCGPKIAITKKKLTGNSITVTVKTTVKGIVTITGAGLRKTTKTLGAGTHTLKVPLTANGRTARNKHHKIKIKAALKAGKKTVSKSTGLKL